MPKPWEPDYFGHKNGDERTAIAHMVNLSRELIEVEELLGRDNDFTAKQIKRLDKAVTVMKVALKIMKKAMGASRKTGAINNSKRATEAT